MKIIILFAILTSCNATILQPTMTEAQMRRSYPEQFSGEVERQEKNKKINECLKLGYSLVDCKNVYDRAWSE